jgi:hypothetical protein
MENQNNSNQDCGCSDGCCTPQKKSNLWKRLLFCIIILAAGTIITVKLVAKNSETTAKCCPQTTNPSCCPQAVSKKEQPACCTKPASSPTPSCCAQPQPEKK